MPTQTVRVKGLERGDETRLEHALRALPGVVFASACSGAGSVEVEFEDDRILPAEIRAEIERLGYAAELAR